MLLISDVTEVVIIISLLAGRMRIPGRGFDVTPGCTRLVTKYRIVIALGRISFLSFFQ